MSFMNLLTIPPPQKATAQQTKPLGKIVKVYKDQNLFSVLLSSVVAPSFIFLTDSSS